MKDIARFHGHLGPYVAIGYRMGLLANRLLGTDPFSKSATVYTMTSPPRSCVVDGIQLASGCTMGKGNIAVCHDEYQVASVFKSKDGRISHRIKLREEMLAVISACQRDRMETLATELFDMSDDCLFQHTREE